MNQNYRIERLRQSSELISLATRWNELSNGNPFQSWEWNCSWWQHFGADHELFVLVIRDADGSIVGIAPWYMEKQASLGRVIRFLGSGVVCSEYLTVLSVAGREEEIASHVAEWLTQPNGDVADNADSDDRWDMLDLDGVAANDRLITQLSAKLASHGASLYSQEGLSCWHISLPNTWDDYLGTLSKNTRKQIRKLLKRLDSGERVCQIHVAKSEDDLAAIWPAFVAMHGRRRSEKGDAGCFAHAHFEAFLRDAASRLIAKQQLELLWLSLDGKPAAFEFQLVGDSTVFAYQSAMEPQEHDWRPGVAATAMTIQRAIASGKQGFDLLRGDEDYKGRWRPTERQMTQLKIASPRVMSRVRHGVWQAGAVFKDWMRESIANRASS